MTAGKESGSKQAGKPKKKLKSGADPSVGKATQFKPGQSGNPAGRPKGKSLSTTIQEMLDDEGFIDRLHEKIKAKFTKADGPDPTYQSTPMKAMITVAMIEAMDPTTHPTIRKDARDFLAKYGYGTKVDVTSKGERISDTPKIISVIQPRDGDASTQIQAS